MTDLELIFNPETMKWEERKQPYITVEIETEEDWEHLKAAIELYKNREKYSEIVNGLWKPVKYDAHCSCGKSYITYHFQCSACKRIAYSQPYGLNYCPNCGAKMDNQIQWSEAQL